MPRYGMTKEGRRVHIVEEDDYVIARSLCNWKVPYEVWGKILPEEVCKDCLAIQAGRRKKRLKPLAGLLEGGVR